MKNCLIKKLPLKGINVVDLTKVLSGPFASSILRDLGANIIKVEQPNGDDSRKFGPFINKKSTYFISLNHGKKSIVLDLKKQVDKNHFIKILKKSDVLIENFKPKTLNNLGFSWKLLSQKFPRLIYAKISGFGETGPLSDLPAYDMVVQAMGGIMSITGQSDNNFSRVGTSIGDIAAGLFCVNGILASLYKRNFTGLGEKIDISMLDCQIAILENAITRCSVLNENPVPMATDHPSITPFGAFKTKDSFIIIAAGNEKIFTNLCLCLSRSDILEDRRFTNNLNRNNNIPTLRKKLEESLINKKTKYWINLFRKNDIPCSEVNKIKDVLKNPQLLERNMFLDYIESSHHKFKISGNPIKFSSVNDSKSVVKAPELNQHRDEILKFFDIDK